MDLFTRLVSPFAVTWNPSPSDPFWYRPTPTGPLNITPESALTVSTVYRGTAVLANTLAMLPLHVQERLPDEGKQKARAHRLYRVLHDRPNRWQTSFQWRQMGMGHAVLRGGFYNRIVSDRRGFAAELVPLHPGRTRVVDQRADGALVYEHITERGEPETLIGGETMFHIAGFSCDGRDGLSVVDLMRTSVEGAINRKRFGTSLFSKAPLMRGFLKTPRVYDAAARKKLEDSFAEANAGGEENWHRAVVLENGMEWQDGGMMSAEDSQFIETENTSIPDFARFIGVPTVLLMHADKTALYANAEQFFQSFLNFDIAHWFVNWESAINQTLFLDSEQEQYFCEFNRDAIVRGDLEARGSFYKIMVELGVFSVNEVRTLEGKNRIDGLDEPTAKPTSPAMVPPMAADALAPQMQGIVTAAARRLVGKECAVVTSILKKYPITPESPEAHHRIQTDEVAKFYTQHAQDIERTLAVSRVVAVAYCAEQRAHLMAGGSVKDWATPEHKALVAHLALVSDPVGQLERRVTALTRQLATLEREPAAPRRRTRVVRDTRTGLIQGLMDEDDDGEAPTIQ